MRFLLHLLRNGGLGYLWHLVLSYQNYEYLMPLADSPAPQTLSSPRGTASKGCKWGREPNSALLPLDPSPGCIQVLTLLLPTHPPCQASSQKPSHSSRGLGMTLGAVVESTRWWAGGNPLWWPRALPMQQDEACTCPPSWQSSYHKVNWCTDR